MLDSKMLIFVLAFAAVVVSIAGSTSETHQQTTERLIKQNRASASEIEKGLLQHQ